LPGEYGGRLITGELEHKAQRIPPATV